MQRTGRKGQAQFRMIVQDSRRTPTSGNIVELLGNYDPHTKVATINKERAEFFLNNGAQPSDRVLRILGFQKVKIPKWVEKTIVKKSKTKNPTKLRKNQPKVEKVAEPEVVEEVATEPVAEVIEEATSTPEVVEEAAETETPVVEAEPEVEVEALAETEPETVAEAETTEEKPE
jgi:small subunit ribosomal protein S16